MDRNTITGLVLIFAIFIGFSLFNNYKKDKSFDAVVVVADSLYDARNYSDARAEYLKALQFKPGDPVIVERVKSLNLLISPEEIVDSAAVDPIQESVISGQSVSESPVEQAPANFDNLGSFAESGSGELSFVTMRNNMMELKISNRGGRLYKAELIDFKTHDGQPLILFDGDSTVFGFHFFTFDNRPIQTNNLYFEAYRTPDFVDASVTTGVVKFRLYSTDNGYIEYTYTLEPDSYMLDFDVAFVKMNNKIASNLNSISFDWKAYIKQQERGRQNENTYTNIKYKHYQAEVDGFRDRSQKDQEQADIPTKIEWVAFKDQFFSTVLINEETFNNGLVETTKMSDESIYHRYFTAELGLPFNPATTTNYNMKVYIGPNHYKTLQNYGYELQEMVLLGKNIIRWINQYVIVNLFNWLNKFINNYGIIILILTLIIKLVLFPLTFKSYQSQAKMKVLKPMVDEIGKKFPKKEDAMKKQQATMALYKKAGVSPLGGCLPMILQMPILFAMFRFFPVSFELRQESFLWATDLSTYDSILNLPFSIPMYGDHVSLFTLLMTVSTIITMKINSPQATGSEQVPGMKMMMYMMPIMFMLILNNFSSGLTYYYFLANIITFGQNLISKRFIDEDAVLRRIEENKKKAPASKSKFQQRLEEAAKQRGYKAKK